MSIRFSPCKPCCTPSGGCAWGNSQYRCIVSGVVPGEQGTDCTCSPPTASFCLYIQFGDPYCIDDANPGQAGCDGGGVIYGSVPVLYGWSVSLWLYPNPEQIGTISNAGQTTQMVYLSVGGRGNHSLESYMVYYAIPWSQFNITGNNVLTKINTIPLGQPYAGSTYPLDTYCIFPDTVSINYEGALTPGSVTALLPSCTPCQCTTPGWNVTFPDFGCQGLTAEFGCDAPFGFPFLLNGPLPCDCTYDTTWYKNQNPRPCLGLGGPTSWELPIFSDPGAQLISTYSGGEQALFGTNWCLKETKVPIENTGLLASCAWSNSGETMGTGCLWGGIGLSVTDVVATLSVGGMYSDFLAGNSAMYQTTAVNCDSMTLTLICNQGAGCWPPSVKVTASTCSKCEGVAIWQWTAVIDANGKTISTSWQLQAGCGINSGCDALLPSFPGTFVGETATTPCQ